MTIDQLTVSLTGAEAAIDDLIVVRDTSEPHVRKKTKNMRFDQLAIAMGALLAGSFQPLDADLTAIAALTTTAYGRSLLTVADAAAARTSLSVYSTAQVDAADAAVAATAAANLAAHTGNTSNPHSVTKAQVGLGNVENTALSTWAGSSNITTLGTIGTGVWQGTAIADTYIASAATWNAKEPAIAAGSAGQYWRYDKTWATLNKAAVAGLTDADSVTFASLSTGSGAISGGAITAAAASGYYLGGNLFSLFSGNEARVYSGSSGFAVFDSTGVTRNLTLTNAGNCTILGSISGGAISGTTGTFSGLVSTPSNVDSGGYAWAYSTASANSRSWRLRNDTYAYGDMVLGISTTQSGSTYADVLTFNASGGNGAWGQTTPAAGSFTTLAASTSITANNGSATTSIISKAGTNALNAGFIAQDQTADRKLELYYFGSAGAGGYGAAAGTSVINAQSALTLSINDAKVVGLSSTGLSVTGNVTGTGVYSTTTASAANVFVDSNGLLQRSTSSLRYKTNVRDYDRGIADVMKLRPIWFDDKRDGSTHAGLAAEEVDAAGLKEFVEYDGEGRPDAIGYGHMVSLAFAGLQDHEREIAALKAEVATLKARLGEAA